MAFSRKDLEGDEDTFRVAEGFGAAKEENKEPPVEDVTVTVDTDDDAAPSSDATETPPDDQVDGTSDDKDENEESSTSDAAPGSETETTKEQTDGNTEKPAPKKGSAAARIQELVNERDGYRAYGEYAQEQLAAREAVIQELKKKVPEPKPTTTGATTVDPMPTMEDADVNYNPQIFDAKMKVWVDRTVEAKVKAKAAPANPADSIVEKFNERANAFAKDHPDFAKNTALLPTFSQPVAKVLVTGDDGVAILNWLGTHKSEAVRIAKLSPEEQLLELGSVRSIIKKGSGTVLPPSTKTSEPSGASKSPAKPKSLSNAPPPPSRLPAGGRRDARDVQDPNMGMDEFARQHREAKAAAREASRKQRMGR
jgi:hypothetical protein